ncbi:MAG: ATP-grasp domain-containing protein [Venatoribacter sp.]
MNLLISSAANKIPLLKAAQQEANKVSPAIQIVAGDACNQVLSAYVAPAFWLMPKTKEANLSQLAEGLKQHRIQFILPTRDGELLFWAKHQAWLQEQGITLLSSSPQALNTCLDKLQFAQFGQANHLPFIPAVAQINEIQAPRLVVKERFGAGGQSVGINLNAEQAQDWTTQLKNPIYQPYIEGEEISIDAWQNRQGQVKGLVLRKRNLIIQGEAQVTTTFTDASIEQQAKQVLEALGLNGHSVTQAILDKNKQLHIIECNPRFGGASTASIQVGLHSLEWSLREAMGEDISHSRFIRAKQEVRQIRVPTDTYE